LDARALSGHATQLRWKNDGEAGCSLLAKRPHGRQGKELNMALDFQQQRQQAHAWLDR
jgi:hypothetical protein